MMFFLLLDYDPGSAHWNVEKFRNPSVNNVISSFCNIKVAKVLRELVAFTYHEMFLMWHLDTLVLRRLFIGHQLGLNQLIFIFTDKGQDCFLITDRFQLVSGEIFIKIAPLEIYLLRKMLCSILILPAVLRVSGGNKYTLRLPLKIFWLPVLYFPVCHNLISVGKFRGVP